MWPYRNLLFSIFLLSWLTTYGQQDVDFHLNGQFLQGKTILKVKRDFYDPYLWVLAKNNQVYRINSNTLVVDDYTPKFAAYNNLQFIDIAGRSQDTVFIATNSTNVIQYKNGEMRFIGAADGIPYTVNSIGVEKSTLGQTTHSLMIATGQGYCTYDMDTEKPVTVWDNGNSKVFEATWRREIYKDSSAVGSGQIGDTIQYLPTISRDEFTIFDEFLWEGGKQFGYNINTAYVATAAIYGYDDAVDYTNWFWGNNMGLFQNRFNWSYSSAYPHAHYLDGINVNKVTGIYGLASFGDAYWPGGPGLIKENLLVGTDVGLYFSSSIYSKFNTEDLRPVSLLHFDELGNVRVNDICVNTASIGPPICEDGVWVACDNGLYLLKPDYTLSLNGQQSNSASFRHRTDGATSINICSGTGATGQINAAGYAGNTIQWYKDGQELPGQSLDSLVINLVGDYYAVLYDPCENLHLETNHLKVTVIQPPVFTFNYDDKLVFCDGTPVTLTAQGSSAYNYRWYTNGTLNGNVTPTASITQSGKYKVEVSACDGSWVPSKEVQVDIIKIPTPTLHTDKLSYCMGDNATLTTGIAADPSYTINWYKDNVLLTANSNQTSLVVNENGSYSVTVTSNKVNTDGTTCTQTTPLQNIIFNPPPTASIQQIVKTALCDGQTVDLKVSYNTGTLQWSTGQSSDLITVSTSGTYSTVVTSAAGCVTNNSINVQFFPNPILNLPSYAVCVPSKKTATLTAPAGMASYTWNGQLGTNTYIVDHPETVTLTVTDTNGCQAIQDIQVVDECPNISIPNAFTPNGDGINDNWDIIGLEYDLTATVKIFTRDGQQIFDSKGYPKPWDGQYKGKQLPSGVYYYIIKAKNNSQTYSGPVTIIY